MSWCVVYLASPRSFHIYNDPAQASRVELLKGSLETARRCFPTVDILVFHEDYTEEEFIQLPGVTKFIEVDFSGQEEFCNRKLRRPYGYLMMCRFFSGVLQNHPALDGYTHYMRLDDDSYLLDPLLSESHVKSLLTHDYVYRSLYMDKQDQQSLYEFTLDFLRKEGYGKNIPTLERELKKKHVVSGDGVYTGIAPYNNFHLASQRLWQNPMVQRYIRAIEESHGILQSGWMDSTIHAMVMYVLALFTGMKIHHDGSFGYRHNQHVSLANSPAVDYRPELPFGLI